MSDVAAVLGEVRALVRHVQVADAQQRLEDLIKVMGPAELRVWEDELRAAIADFLPKRQKALRELLDHEIHASIGSSGRQEGSSGSTAPEELGRLVLDLELALSDLSRFHIFQWSTFYRETLADFFDSALQLATGVDASKEWSALDAVVANHAHEIFTKGFMHVTRTGTELYALQKACGGLRRFLDLIVENYASTAVPNLTTPRAIASRNLTSALIVGVLRGFARVDFGGLGGDKALIQRQNYWLYTLAFINRPAIAAVAGLFPAGDTSAGIRQCVMPLTLALDKMIATATDYAPMPVLAEFDTSSKRLDVSLMPAPLSLERRFIEIQCFLSAPTRADLAEAMARGVSLLIADLPADLSHIVSTDADYASMIVRPSQAATAADEDTAVRVREVLDLAIYRDRNPRSLVKRPLEYNFARDFPLSSPSVGRYYFVVRESVRDLLRTFEKRNGVRLWCSVRRSGKTTAGEDLASSTADTVLVSQTCDSTGHADNDHYVYDGICAAIEAGKRVPSDFFRTLIDNSSDAPSTDGRRVLVLDEYETLFGELRTAVAADERLRYTVVQPLLNQMVEFTRENLLVFLGQQPNAHLILMDQNQLSPYVQQDAFPLFQHGKNINEFSELVGKVFAGRATFDVDFVDRVHLETAGHPFLTVNLLVEFVEWLIRQKRSVTDLHFNASDFSAFASRGLRRDRIAQAREYAFFRDGAVPQALSTLSRERSPWLYSMYTLVRHISRESPESFSCSIQEFHQIVDGLGLSELGFSAEDLLNTGEASNFLASNGRFVGPRIRILGRIAACASPAVI